ncbi:MAG: helix-turn-helix domain-containing protein [Erysipelotrichaceae bacterium]|nr:helix-turn-helix domain-containing protein [Erysipelotrichaceae bacterium]
MRKDYTRFGEELRVLRTRRHQNQQEMADVLGVTKNFLSMVEKGKKAIPEKWIDILTDYYHLKPYPRQLLIDAAEASKIRIKIDLKGAPLYKRDLAVAFERCFDRIDEDAAESIMKILNES